MVNRFLTRYRIEVRQTKPEIVKKRPNQGPFVESHVCECDISKCLSVTGLGQGFLHDLETGKIVRHLKCCYNDISSFTVAGGVAPLYFLGSNTGSIALADLRITNKIGNCLFQLQRCHLGPINTLYNMKSRDYVIISSGYDGYLKLFDLRYPCKMQISQNHYQALPFSTFRLTKSYSNMQFSVSPDEKILSISINEEALICTLDTQIRVIKSCNVESGDITKTQFSNDNAKLFISLTNDTDQTELVSWYMSQNFITWQSYAISSDLSDIFYDSLGNDMKTTPSFKRERFKDKKLTFTLMGKQCVTSTTVDNYHYLDIFDAQTAKHLSTTISHMSDCQQLHLEFHPKNLLISSHYNNATNNKTSEKNYVKLIIHQMIEHMESTITHYHCHPISAVVST